MWNFFYLWLISLKLTGFPGVSVAKNPPAMQEGRVGSLSWEDPLEKETTTSSSILAWEIPWTGTTWWATVYGGCRRVGHDLVTKHTGSLTLIPAPHTFQTNMWNITIMKVKIINKKNNKTGDRGRILASHFCFNQESLSFSVILSHMIFVKVCLLKM